MFKLMLSQRETFTKAVLTAHNVARTLASTLPLAGQSADVTEHVHVASDGRTERGATVVIYTKGEAIPFDVFDVLRDTYGLTCAWMEAPDYSGCILKHPRAARYIGGVDKRDTFPPDPRRMPAHGDPLGRMALSGGVVSW